MYFIKLALRSAYECTKIYQVLFQKKSSCISNTEMVLMWK